jgi:hypothetical protein
MPERIQLKRTKGWRMPPGAVKVDRSTKYGNPFVLGKPIKRDSDLWPYLVAAVPALADRSSALGRLQSVTLRRAEDAVAAYSIWFIEQPHLMIAAFEELPGRDIADWCKPGDPCHGNWLMDMVNETEDAEVTP